MIWPIENSEKYFFNSPGYHLWKLDFVVTDICVMINQLFFAVSQFVEVGRTFRLDYNSEPFQMNIYLLVCLAIYMWCISIISWGTREKIEQRVCFTYSLINKYNTGLSVLLSTQISYPYDMIRQARAAYDERASRKLRLQVYHYDKSTIPLGIFSQLDHCLQGNLVKS